MITSSSKKPLRIGVVGCGVMGRNHARVLSDMAEADLVGICDPDLATAKSIADSLGTTAVATLDELLALEPDALTIAAPTHLHHDVALKAIAHGVHVLVEKPIASTSQEGCDIVKAAHDKGVTLMVGHVERFNPAAQTIKKAIEGEDILSIQIARVGPFPPRMSNVGVVIDLAVHDIDLIRWFTAPTSPKSSRRRCRPWPSARTSRSSSSAPPTACSPRSTPIG